MNVKAISGVLLDIDDTLVNTRAAFRQALAAVAEDYLPGPYDLDAMGMLWRVDAGDWYRAYTRGEMTAREQRMRRANELHEAFGGDTMNDDEYDAWDAIFEAAFRAGSIAHDDAHPLLDTFERCGIEYGAVSNAAHSYQERKLALSGLGRVRMLVGIDRFGVGKPDPRVFLEGARMLGLDPASVAYVGDELDIDANAAAAAGLAVGMWLDRPGSMHQPGEWGTNVVRIESLADVPQVLSLPL
jgi:putative hydrolase of the HAD superfamily